MKPNPFTTDRLPDFTRVVQEVTKAELKAADSVRVRLEGKRKP